MEIKDRFKILIKELCITQAELARCLNFSKGNISKYFQGQLTPGKKFLGLLEEKLNINPAWVIYGEGTMFLDQQKTIESKYPDFDKFVQETGMSEKEVLTILKMYTQAPSQKAFDLLVQSSKGNKDSIDLLYKYLEGLKVISE